MGCSDERVLHKIRHGLAPPTRQFFNRKEINMIGRNEFTLCASELFRAVEFYLKEKVLKDQEIKIISLEKSLEKEGGMGMAYKVTLEGLEKLK